MCRDGTFVKCKRSWFVVLYSSYVKRKAHSLWKESLNNYGQQFHQYEHNEQSAVILTELTEYKKDHDMWRGKSSPNFGQASTMWRV